MFISTWQIFLCLIGLAVFWFGKVRFIDIPAEKQARIEAGEKELRDRAKRHVYQIQADGGYKQEGSSREHPQRGCHLSRRENLS